jgi:hypothetical protein
MSTLNTEFTNLLPRKQVRALRREYFVRLTTIVLGLGVLAVLIHGVLLFPAYLYARAQVAREQADLARVENSASSAQERDITKRIASVQADMTYLGRLGTQPTASGAVRAVIGIPHPGIILTGFTYTAPTKESKDARMAVSGVASTRVALRQYADSLGQLPYVSNADLPISAYAKESNIPFTITLTGSLTP